MKYAFLRGDDVLKAWGYVESNEVGDTKIEVADDFSLLPYEWKRVGGQWIGHIEP